MNPKTSLGWFRWIYNVLLWFIASTLIVVISELFAGPALQWLLYDIPYQLPTWDRAGRMAVFVVLFSVFAGTVTWFYEKKVSGR
jgi:hypothetical protein